jgi:hypothetical protein
VRVLLLSRFGRRAPSSRLRYYQHLPWLAGQGVNVTVRPLLSDRYLLARWAGDPV